jgi:hypothetical protein
MNHLAQRIPATGYVTEHPPTELSEMLPMLFERESTGLQLRVDRLRAVQELVRRHAVAVHGDQVLRVRDVPPTIIDHHRPEAGLDAPRIHLRERRIDRHSE